tara:strand:- start:2980 stop:3648 length:669 start_codon:yes stop_codon:yes gene_type:complete
MTMVDDLFLPDFKRLTSTIAGRPGSGKSYMIKKALRSFLSTNQDENLRVLYICPKHEFRFDNTKVTTLYNLQKSLRNNRLTIMYPDPVFFEAETDGAVDMMFSLREANDENFKGVIIIDDAQLILDSRRSASASMKRLILMGRSKGIRAVLVAHSPIINKLMEGSTEHLITFSLPYVNVYGDAKKRFGVDLEPIQLKIAEEPYSFAWFDLVKGTTRLMRPIE